MTNKQSSSDNEGLYDDNTSSDSKKKGIELDSMSENDPLNDNFDFENDDLMEENKEPNMDLDRSEHGSQSSNYIPEIKRTKSYELATKYQERRQKLNRLRELKVKNKKVDEGTEDDLKKELEIDEHKLDLKNLLKRLETDEERGLTHEIAREKLEVNGPNVLTPPKKTPKFFKFLKEFTGGFALLLLAGSLLSGFGYALDTEAIDYLYLCIVLFLVVFITACFSYYQQAKSDAIMEGFKKLVPEFALVIREGEQQKIDSTLVVPGDIIVVKAGSKVPADFRILKTDNFKVDNSSLTGESEPVARSVECTSDNPLETHNLAFYSTLANEGVAKGVVIRTGDATLIGHIASLTIVTKPAPTPIHIEINKFIHLISYVAIFLGVVFFGFGISIKTPWITNLIFCIGIIVANVPEGLLSTVTVSLTLTAKRMSKKFVLVKNLESVETLGSTSVICSDKTGTLTQNRMTVAHLWYDSCSYNADTRIDHRFNQVDPSFQTLFDIMALCNNAIFLPDQQEVPVLKRKTDGDASESALLKFCEPIKKVKEYRLDYPKVAEILFNSKNKYQLSIHSDYEHENRPLKVVMKGAPERIIDRCSHILIEGKREKIDESWIQKFHDANNSFGSMGERVLGFCTMELDPEQYKHDFNFNVVKPNFPVEEGFTFVGLVSMIDPPKPGVREAVANCHSSGIKIIMVTGDQAITARAIAEDVGILTRGNVENGVGIVVTGSELKEMSSEDLDEIIKYDEIVFARTSPQQKLIIVEACQRAGHVTAVTGDGTNDAPALKKADIGVAMGIGGSDVAKEAANMILLDDNFASIVNGVEEGRLIFDNLKKSIAYTLTSNIPEITPFLTFITLGLPLPLTTLMILCIDLGTDLWPAISLAYETAETDIMKRLPRNSKTERLVSKKMISFTYLQIGMIQALAGFACYFVVLMDHGIRPTELFFKNIDFVDKNIILFGMDYDERMLALRTAQSAFLVSIVIVQWADLLISKTRRLSLFQQGLKNNKALISGLIFETVLVCLFIYLPGVNQVLGAEPLKFQYWLVAIPFSILIFLYDEGRKYFLRKTANGWVERFTQY
ncbi:sodium/potassium-transporting atpase subunit alpha [Anaeramoeba flamelloides]|uniref:Sodium/potassium-transporting ATPase subunit alpha n=1 Tax=Anaeramoeba flamelloides TaxID=1746091 RepID=A0AAV8A5B5_9EUKA|nr:sodium/potassium-transporting atpase subunit alpha [Anaeramoeba flamelloides]|eukprot:Anaeramoba_flamelloidesa566881_563.p1 GENE.a566881_563~~a566881_563.p1  ORF type:complete len:1073 (-),score=283.63 a566881_563:144-3362(-)